MYVYPGGSVRKADSSKGMLRRCRGLSPSEAQKTLGMHLSPALSLGYWVAAIRELFEEVGILLCVTESGKPLDMNNVEEKNRKDRMSKKRSALINGALDFQALLESEGLPF